MGRKDDSLIPGKASYMMLLMTKRYPPQAIATRYLSLLLPHMPIVSTSDIF